MKDRNDKLTKSLTKKQTLFKTKPSKLWPVIFNFFLVLRHG